MERRGKRMRAFNPGVTHLEHQAMLHPNSPKGAIQLAIEEKYSEDVQKLLDMGKEKTFLTYDDINQELPEGLVSPDEIEDIFATLGAEGIAISDSEEKFLESAAAAGGDKKLDEMQEEELELDLSPGTLDKTNDPVRLYLREMGVVPLLTREGEVAIAKRIERGKLRAQKAVSRSPVAVAEILKIGEELRAERSPFGRSSPSPSRKALPRRRSKSITSTLSTRSPSSRSHSRRRMHSMKRYWLSPRDRRS